MADDVKSKLEAKKKRLEELKQARLQRSKPTQVIQFCLVRHVLMLHTITLLHRAQHIINHSSSMIWTYGPSRGILWRG